MMDVILTCIGLLATVFSVVSTLPQIKKALKTKDTNDISIRFLLILIAGLIFWVIYGMGREDMVIVVGNSIGVSFNLFLMFLKIKYSRNPMAEK